MLTGKAASKLPATQTPQPETPATGTVTLDGQEGLSCDAEIVNYWSSGGDTFYQYNLTVKNNTGTGCRSWKLTLPFSGKFSLQSSWNGDYTVSGNSLVITARDYNGAIAAGGTAENIGFIISGSGSLRLVED